MASIVSTHRFFLEHYWTVVPVNQLLTQAAVQKTEIDWRARAQEGLIQRQQKRDD